MATSKKSAPPPAYRIFISSTYMDMIAYRDAIQSAITNCDAVAYGMERFVASPLRPLDRCYEEISNSQIFILLLGHRYGDIDKDSGKSFTELEYIRAKKNGLPILAFLLDTDVVGTPEKFRESDIQYEALCRFKKELTGNKELTVGRFSSQDDLKEQATRAIAETITRLQLLNSTAKSWNNGAMLFAKFIKRPEKYRGQEAVLRVRMDGKYGDTRLREELYDAFNMPVGNAMFINALFVLGGTVDVDVTGWLIDAWAPEESADWLEENGVTTGTTFEAKFRFAYEIVKDGGGISGRPPRDIHRAMLIMIEGFRTIETEPLQPKRSIDGIIDELRRIPQQDLFRIFQLAINDDQQSSE